MDEAKRILRDPSMPYSLDIIYNGSRRTIYYTPETDIFTINIRGSRDFTLPFNNQHWEDITKIYKPEIQNTAQKQAAKEQKGRKLTIKYFIEANESKFQNSFIEACLNADIQKSPYENGLCTGTKIDGRIITIETIRKGAGQIVDEYLKALRQNKIYKSKQFFLHNYYCQMYVEHDNKGRASGVFVQRKKRNKYYRFNMINERAFIGHSVVNDERIK